jgi:hypothetical protein|nr:MAG TPA: hypothetical protein [Caudoviricetes sp.]
MSDFQKQTLKRYARNFLILCGFILLVYGMIKFTFVLYATVAIMVLTIVGGCAWSMISSIRWDWRLRGKLTESEYKAYKVCDWMFGWRDDEYLPTGDQIVWIAEHNDISCETLWSMFEKLEGENQNGKQMS